MGKTTFEHPQCEHVFHLQRKPFHDFRPEWKAASKEAGLVDENGKPKLLFHDLRRSAVRNLLRGGVPEKVAMAISGHRTRAVFDRYHIVSESDLRTAITRLSNYISRQESEAAAGAGKSAIGTLETDPHTIHAQEGNQRLQ